MTSKKGTKCLTMRDFKRIADERKRWLNMKIEKVEDATKFFDYVREHTGYDCAWSLQYYGFGEHFTFWPGDGTFTDFNIDKGTAFGWGKMKVILVVSAKHLQEHLKVMMK